MSLIIGMNDVIEYIKQLEENNKNMKDKIKKLEDEKIQKLEDEKIQKQNKKYTQREFVEYVLRNGRSLTAKQIYEEILEIPCENPWIDDPDDPKTPDATINSLCGRLYKKDILDREQINGTFVYWLN